MWRIIAPSFGIKYLALLQKLSKEYFPKSAKGKCFPLHKQLIVHDDELTRNGIPFVKVSFVEMMHNPDLVRTYQHIISNIITYNPCECICLVADTSAKSTVLNNVPICVSQVLKFNHLFKS
jgi:hypothetical protein